MPVQIQIRRGTASDWTSANPTLASGEIGYETDTAFLKIGDGSTNWNSLAYTLKQTAAGKAILDDADAAAQRTTLGITNIGSYTGQIETVADKTYTIDPGAATARVITGFYIKSASGTVTATLKNASATVKAASVSSSSGDQSSLANTSVSANGVISIVTSSNSSATDVIFAVEYTE
tara:strand:+ start:37 stop:567 length:531 start_codon:yes stop_codon:yes gene_type:complete